MKKLAIFLIFCCFFALFVGCSNNLDIYYFYFNSDSTSLYLTENLNLNTLKTSHNFEGKHTCSFSLMDKSFGDIINNILFPKKSGTTKLVCNAFYNQKLYSAQTELKIIFDDDTTNFASSLQFYYGYNQTEVCLPVGGMANLTALPNTDIDIEYQIANTEIATYNKASNILTAKKFGTTTITAKVKSGFNKLTQQYMFICKTINIVVEEDINSLNVQFLNKSYSQQSEFVFDDESETDGYIFFENLKNISIQKLKHNFGFENLSYQTPAAYSNGIVVPFKILDWGKIYGNFIYSNISGREVASNFININFLKTGTKLPATLVISHLTIDKDLKQINFMWTIYANDNSIVDCPLAFTFKVGGNVFSLQDATFISSAVINANLCTISYKSQMDFEIIVKPLKAQNISQSIIVNID